MNDLQTVRHVRFHYTIRNTPGLESHAVIAPTPLADPNTQKEFSYMGRLRWILYSAALVFASITSLGIIGCGANPKNPSTQAKSQDESQRPPLRILLVGESSPKDASQTETTPKPTTPQPTTLRESLARRWKGASQQAIEVTSISQSEWLALDKCRTDVVLFPATHLSEAIERKWIRPLPPSFDKYHSAKDNDLDTELAWPNAWKQLVHYGKQYWGVPLGLSPVVVCRPTNDSPGPPSLQALLQSPSPPPSSTASATPPRSHLVDQDHAIVDRFLTLLLAKSHRTPLSGILFHPSTMKPRLHESDCLQATRDFAELVERFGNTWLDSHETMWQDISLNPQRWGIANPGTWTVEAFENANDVEVGHFTIQDEGLSHEVWVESGAGWIAAQAQESRQSAVSIYFLEWLDQEEQRESLQRESPRIQPRRAGLGRIAAQRPDLSKYVRANLAALDRSDAVLELRLPGSHIYRQELAKALRLAAKDPAKSADYLAECSQAWERQTELYGRDRLRQALERNLQLMGMSGK